MGTWRWFSTEHCDATSSCVVVDAWLQLVLCILASLSALVLLFLFCGCLTRWCRRRQRRLQHPEDAVSGSRRATGSGSGSLGDQIWFQAFGLSSAATASSSPSSPRRRWGWNLWSFWRSSSSSSSKTAPMPLAVIQKDADEAHITSHKNSIKQAFEFMQQTQRVSRVDFALQQQADKDAAQAKQSQGRSNATEELPGQAATETRPSSPRRPSGGTSMGARSLSLMHRLGESFSRRNSRGTPSGGDDNPSPRRRQSYDHQRQHQQQHHQQLQDRHQHRHRKGSEPDATTRRSSGSQRGSLNTSSLESGDRRATTSGPQLPGDTQDPHADAGAAAGGGGGGGSVEDPDDDAHATSRERSSSFRQRIATAFTPHFIRARQQSNQTPPPQSHSRNRTTSTTTSKSKTATSARRTTFDDQPSYRRRQQLAALSPEHRKRKERRGSVEMRDKRRLSVGVEAQIHFDVSDGLGDAMASVYEVKLKEITLVKRLALGPLSEVYAAIWRDTKVGVKLLMPREGVTDRLEEAVKNFRREIWVMNALRHPNIVKLIGASLTPTCYVLVMEYMSNGSLYEYLRDEANFFPHQMVTTSALDIADGMRHIHSCSVLQRDLKSKNCLVSENLVVKVADFGLARFTLPLSERSQYTFVGTPYWAAPEVIRHEPYDEKADVYSYAIVLWELVERCDPYADRNPFQVPLLVANDGLRPSDFTSSAPLGLEQLMKQCWDADPDQRPSFDEIAETLQKWLAQPVSSTPDGDADGDADGDDAASQQLKQQQEKEGDLSAHIQRERHCAGERELSRFASSHNANAKTIPIVLSRGATEQTISVRQRRSSAIAMLQQLPRPASDRSLSRGISNNSI